MWAWEFMKILRLLLNDTASATHGNIQYDSVSLELFLF